MAHDFKSPVLQELAWRGFIKQTTHDTLDEKLAEESLTLYCGFDPTAKSLHVGNLIGIMALLHFQRHGHQPLALVGGATGRIGDPSGKDEERELLDEHTLAENIAAIKTQLDQVSHRATDAVQDSEGIAIVDNYDWFGDVNYLAFLRDVGKHFSVNTMIAKESVRARLNEREQGISYTEFSYMLIQAYDYWHLFNDRDCRLQIGGSDQWGNITAGTEQIRLYPGGDDDAHKAFGLTFPLLTSADGKKLGKSVGGAIFLDAQLTSPYEFYQYWVNRDDSDCSKLLRIFTLLPREEIEALEATIEAGENRGEVQQKLAFEVTSLIHGAEEAKKVVRASKMLFGEKIEGLSDADLQAIFADVPSTELSWDKLRGGELGILDAFTTAELQRSNGATRRLIKQGGAYLNNEKIEDARRMLSPDDLASESMLVLRSGKKKYHVLRFVD